MYLSTSYDRMIAAVFLLALLGASLWVTAPFMTALFWASILAFATWPAMGLLTRKLNGRVSLAAGLLTAGWMLLVAVPLLLLGAKLPEQLRDLTELVRTLRVDGLPSAPDWLGSIPWVGHLAANTWNNIEQEGAAAIKAARPHAGAIANWLLGKSLVMIGGMLELCLSLVLVFFFYRDGPAIASLASQVLARIVGDKAPHYVDLVAGTVQRVVNGVIGTAAAQGFLAWIGFAVAGIPGSFMLGVLVFFFGLIPMGPPLVWMPVLGWLFYQGDVTPAILLGLWCFFVVSGVDNVLKPYLISRGGTLPLVVVLIGVIGGMMTFGFMGLFIGPTVLAVSYSLINDWTSRQKL